MRWLKWLLVFVAGFVVLLAAWSSWIVTTPSGTRWAAGVADQWFGEALTLGAVDGTLAGPLILANLHYRDATAGLELNAARIAVDVQLLDLLRGVVHIKQAELQGIDLALETPSQPPPQSSAPFTLQPPIDVVIESLAVRDLEVLRQAVPVFAIIEAGFAGHWTRQDLAVRQLDLRSPQGEVHFSGRVRQDATYRGEGRGRFRWRAGENVYAGELKTLASGADATLDLALTAPLSARLEASVEQRASWPWRFTLEAPRFDPRAQLLPASKLYSLAASLKGAGTLEGGAISGTLLINDEPLHLDPLRFARQEQRLSIDSVLRIGGAPGRLQVQGDIELAQEPLSAALEARWDELVIPAVWAGQDLHTRGELTLNGSAQAYKARGALALGPTGRPADIALNISGTPSAIELHQLDVVQKAGRIGIRGKVDLTPRVAWTVSGESRGFDPGSFAAGWRGSVSFGLASQGHLTQAGPEATLKLVDLSGELRGRKLAGHADLALTPALVPAGALFLRSGESELSFQGEPGEQIDARIALDVATLNDWLPDSSGEIKARFDVSGRWPELSIEGQARGRDLHAANVGVETLAVDARLDNPRSPEGSLRVDLTQLAASGFEFATVQARMSGGLEAHRFELSASGKPLSLDLALQGTRAAAGWSGTLQRLVVDVPSAARLALRDPARLVVGGGAFELSRACLADGDIELCANVALQPDGSMQAGYSLAGLPLALANVLAPADLPLALAGTLRGQGQVRRTTNGELFGDVAIHSPAGRVSRAPVAEGDAAEAETLLAYQDFRLAANLAGPEARATVGMKLQENGSVNGEALLRRLGQPQTSVTGRLSATLPDLAPLGLFVPQLANVHGRAQAQIDVSGALARPQFSGQLEASELAADVPEIGLHLKNGTLRARPVSGEVIELSGGIESGAGRLNLAGTASPSGQIHLSVNGERFLAADIPGARVIVTPDVTLTRAEERMTLAGNVSIPEAVINLQKLPRGDRAQQASADVVVIDATTREDEAEKLPVFANITVSLGDKVELTGFGLQAQVKGRLDVRERPGEVTVGSGEVRVAGKYKAYGQDLTIRQGQLLYAATPLDNPRLNIEAIREVDNVTAGLRVRGSARSPELTVFSDPPMAQADALAYVVTGKPLTEVGNDDEEGDLMQSAARSLGASAGGLLAKSVGRRLGVDELAVKDDELIGGSALTVGQYLSPRLYLSYGIGLFEPGEVVTLRYKLSNDLAVQAQRGPEDTRAGIEYRREK